MNDSVGVEGDGESVPLGWIMAAQVWAWTVSCVGGVGNFVTICAISYQLYLGRVWRRRYGPVGRPVVTLEGDTILLLHLSICDFLYCVVNLPVTAITYNYSLGHTPHQPSKLFCTGAALFRYVNALAEWTTLGLLTVERCVDLGRSRGARFFRPRPTLLFIAGIWGHFSYDVDTFKCDMTHRTARLYFYALHSLLPCALMMVGCGSIIWQVHANSRALHDAGMSQEMVARRDRNLARSTVLLLALLLLFLACVLPVCAYNLYTLLSQTPSVHLNVAIYMIYWVQYGVNFCVYAAVNPKFRRAYRDLFLGSGMGSGGNSGGKEQEQEAQSGHQGKHTSHQ
ncbi:protein trapped in endoderm-1-like isoform X3 [Portunus trituberculatus]|uniref:protein trapped in endoderm-1-like isoform X3 n=1 Tax=Portunus trituberculatus TaxID=210409 RepID=UPI001E1CB55E|nr:protein trapped in endoderm-1-like isoform X3 [Portunus trituberculatus]